MKTILYSLSLLLAAHFLAASNVAYTFTDLADLKKVNDVVAIQLGDAGGVWFKAEGAAESNGGTVVAIDANSHWKRQCDPGRLDARSFGVKADGVTDDSQALQAALDALPAEGGKLLLPSGRMLCRQSLKIGRSYITIEGTNCGLLSKYFEPGSQIGMGSLLVFEGCDGIIVEPPAREEGKKRPPRLGGITFRDFGVAGTGRQDGQRGIVVRRGINWPWGSTDGLLMDRIYTIELEWGVDLDGCDMSVIRDSWFSECGNGLRMQHCIYTLISGICFADNDGYGIYMKSGKGNEVASSVFVRNEIGLYVEDTKRTRVIGGTFEADPHGGKRSDTDFIRSVRNQAMLVSAATFVSEKVGIDSAVNYTGAAPTVTGCTISGEVMHLHEEIK